MSSRTATGNRFLLCIESATANKEQPMAEENLPCWVYRSALRQEMYLFLAEEDAFDRVPAELLERFGEPIPVIALELNAERQLAREDVTKVMANLRERGFHLQLPPQLAPQLYHGNPD
jgi:uncharacterized protein YcgL (UPF0745 family)